MGLLGVLAQAWIIFARRKWERLERHGRGRDAMDGDWEDRPAQDDWWAGPGLPQGSPGSPLVFAAVMGRYLPTWGMERGIVRVTWLDGRMDRASFGLGDTVGDLKRRLVEGGADPRLQLVHDFRILRDGEALADVSSVAP